MVVGWRPQFLVTCTFSHAMSPDFPPEHVIQESNQHGSCNVFYDLVSEVTVTSTIFYSLEKSYWDFSGGPVVKNPPCNAGDMGLIPGRGTRIPYAAGQLSPHTTAREPVCCNYRAHVLWSPCATTTEAHMLWSLCTITTEPASHN